LPVNRPSKKKTNIKNNIVINLRPNRLLITATYISFSDNKINIIPGTRKISAKLFAKTFVISNIDSEDRENDTSNIPSNDIIEL
jgi:hypothetical protein